MKKLSKLKKAMDDLCAGRVEAVTCVRMKSGKIIVVTSLPAQRDARRKKK